MIELIRKIKNLNKGQKKSNNIGEEDSRLYQFSQNELLYTSVDVHLPVPIYTYIKPKLGHQFALHILLPMGKFKIEIDLTLKLTLIESL